MWFNYQLSCKYSWKSISQKIRKKPSVKFSNLNPLLVWDISLALQRYFPLACGFGERDGISVLKNRMLKEDGLIINAYLCWFGFFCMFFYLPRGYHTVYHLMKHSVFVSDMALGKTLLTIHAFLETSFMSGHAGVLHLLYMWNLHWFSRVFGCSGELHLQKLFSWQKL